MSKVIIYPHQNKLGGIEILMPSGELSIDEVARKDVPAKYPYLIIDESLLPVEHNDFFEAWEADFSNPDGYGDNYGVGTNLAVIEYVDGNATKVRNDITQEISFTEYGNQLIAEGYYDNN